MTMSPCRFDTVIVHAARTAAWTPALRAHLDTCPDCRLTAALTEQLAPVVAAAAATAPPPPRDPRSLWWQARRSRGAAAARRSARLRVIAVLAVPSLAAAAFTVVRGADAWARLVPASAPDPTTPMLVAAALALIMIGWVVQSVRAR